MMGRNIHFIGVIWKIIPKLSLLRLLIWSTVNVHIKELFLYKINSECRSSSSKERIKRCQGLPEVFGLAEVLHYFLKTMENLNFPHFIHSDFFISSK